jgi:hypothetical protein
VKVLLEIIRDRAKTQFFVVVVTKFTVFWFVTPCNLVEHYQCFRGTRLLYSAGCRNILSTIYNWSNILLL